MNSIIKQSAGIFLCNSKLSLNSDGQLALTYCKKLLKFSSINSICFIGAINKKMTEIVGSTTHNRKSDVEVLHKMACKIAENSVKYGFDKGIIKPAAESALENGAKRKRSQKPSVRLQLLEELYN